MKTSFFIKIFLLLLITSSSIHPIWYKPSTWQWVQKWRWDFIPYISTFFSQNKNEKRVSPQPVITKKQIENNVKTQPIPKQPHHQEKYISEIEIKKNPPILQKETEKTDQENPVSSEKNDTSLGQIKNIIKQNTLASQIASQEKAITKLPKDMALLYLPFHKGYPLYSVSFAIRYLDGYVKDRAACSLEIAYHDQIPLFSFKVPLKSSEEILHSQGLHVPLFHELVAPFLQGEFFHGRFVLSNEMFKKIVNQNPAKYSKIRGISLQNNRSVAKYFMMPLNNRLPFNKDTQVQKLFYAFITTSLVANTFDVINIDPELGAEIKENQKLLAEYYRQLFLDRIKELASQNTTIMPKI